MTTLFAKKRIEQSVNGFEALLYYLPFDVGVHGYNDHAHAENFVRYLFSKSKAHPENDLTGLNLITEFSDDGGVVRRGYNKDPFGRLQSFLRERFPDDGAHETHFDDGCYPLFAVRLPGGRTLSNFMRAEEGEPVHLGHPLLGHLPQVGVSAWQVETDAMGLAARGEVVDFESAADGQDKYLVEACVHGLLRSHMGHAKNVVLTVTHRDQPDRNPIYHVHRLVRR